MSIQSRVQCCKCGMVLMHCPGCGEGGYMSALKWQPEPPTVDGLYFWRPVRGTRSVGQVKNGMVEFPTIGGESVAIALAVFSGVEWAGPIVEPGE